MWDWFEHYWSSVGLGAAAVLLALLFFTDLFRQNLAVSRWRDPVWLAWTMPAAYMLHNFEEYGIDARGHAFAFPASACDTFGFDGVSGCPFTPAFFVSVNIPFIWIVMVAAAVLARRHHAIGLAGAGLLLTNALSHITGLATPMGYSPGTLTAGIIFIPLAAWTLATCFGPGKPSYPTLAANLLASVLAQLVLLGMLAGLRNGALSEAAAITIQTFDPLLLLVIPWLADRTWPSQPAPAHEAPAQSAATANG
ncbi:HXXEE domain-containing protein [Actinoplanes sp. NPDC051851]|uniref:HXXEE domain-containing protein n=1 Tax=Actinoplanes sp. NPDC051851 TaxID=3154753 RepID=UPI00342B3ED2